MAVEDVSPYYIPWGVLKPAGETREAGRYVNVRLNMDDLPDVKAAGNSFVPVQFAKNIIQRQIVDQKYWYWSVEGSAGYLTAKYGKKGYKMGKDSMATLRDIMPEVLELVADDFKRHKIIDFVALGVADMDKESVILREFIDKFGGPGGLNTTFIPVEQSFHLMTKALKQIDTKFELDIISKSLAVRPYLTDFTSVYDAELPKNDARFITAFGIIHNAAFPEILGTFRAMMSEDSYLLADVGIRDDRTDEEIIKEYSSETNQAFAYSPIKLLYSMSIYDEKILTDCGDVIGNMRDFAGCTMENGTVTVEVIDGRSVIDFCKKHGLESGIADFLKISPSPDDRTIVQVYKAKSGNFTKPVIIMRSTRFKYEGICKVIEQAGFEIVKTWNDPQKSTIGYFLLRLKR